MRHFHRLSVQCLLLTLLTTVAGCNGGQTSWEGGGGPALTTQPGQQLTESMFLGTWSVDGPGTNRANGVDSPTYIPNEAMAKVLGKGWRFNPGGRMTIAGADKASGGTWSIRATNLVVIEGATTGSRRYDASFREGRLRLKPVHGDWLVLRRVER